MNKCGPGLAGQKIGDGMAIHYVHRDLSAGRITEMCGLHGAVYAKARNRFRLFKIVHRNYEEWQKFVKPMPREKRSSLGENEMLVESDRLMQNFLNSAKALFDHFAQYYKQTYHTTKHAGKFNQLLQNLQIKYWAFAFFRISEILGITFAVCLQAISTDAIITAS